MRVLRILKNDEEFDVLFYDQEKDSDSGIAMQKLDEILYSLVSGDVLQIFCLE